MGTEYGKESSSLTYMYFYPKARQPGLLTLGMKPDPCRLPLMVGLSTPLHESVSGRSENVPLGGGLDRPVLTL